ncbi:MAG: hypothetical protein R3248_02970 [Candidatus Promineifilaceae bacterium]|nr:hypothetical protein [Candidatus Promineifilaceae bacterium]
MIDETSILRQRLDGAQRWALLLGAGGTVAALAGAFLSEAGAERFFRAYLVAYIFWAGLALGCLALLMLHHLVGGSWSFPLQRPLTAGARTLPLAALFFLPILSRLEDLYRWARPAAVQVDPILQEKALYLNVPFFLGRAAFYFLVWIGLALIISRFAYGTDRASDEERQSRLARYAQRLSGPGLLLYVLTATFAAVDWVMSLEPHWYSSIYGLLYVGRQVLGALALVLALLGLFHRRPPLSGLLTDRVVKDLGNLLLAALISWSYLYFVQYLVIWQANIPEEAVWFVRRTSGGWQWVALLIGLLHFVLPFALLLLQQGRREMAQLAAIGVLLLVMRLVDTFWLVMPAFHPAALSLHWLDAILPLALGGWWAALYVWQLKRHPLLPYNHPKFKTLVERYGTTG